ncbi:response regulator [Microseira wollei]|uniref:Circadian input-output histidine kinase CikA n=1 Tax=Microseira wollei NIES-4236 TaxID=2530354 RepID=A0AAV3X9W8_9CYAN|nr:response regulator [Microseira wollei]GET39632.1 multi-sensor hybrid histidine kinase [Microseira wollei NIES-4236]
MNNQFIATEKANILIVDDTLENLRLLSNMLTQEGYKVRGVPKGQKAIATAQLAPPDLILLDIMMPEMDGFEVCQQLKAEEKTRDIPVIFLSALNDTLDKIKAFSVGGVDYITKPFHVEEVLARVENQLRLRSLQKQLLEQNTILQKQIRERQVLEKRLRDSEAEMRGFFEAMSDIVLFINGEDNSIKIAPTNPDRFYPPDTDILGQTIELFSGEKAEIFNSKIKQAREIQQPINFEYSLELENQQIWFIASIAPTSENTVVWVARDISDRILAEAAQKRRAIIDNLLGNISRAFLDQDIDTAIDFTLSKIGEYTGSDRSYIIRFCDQQKYLSMTHEWCAKTAVPPTQLLQEIPCETFPWMYEQLLLGKTVLISDVDNLPPEAVADKTALTRLSTRSLINIPLLHRNQLVGCIGLVTVHAAKQWTEEEINLLKLVGEIVAIGLARNDAEIERQQAAAAAFAASKAKSEFLANMSHELRTPLTAILGLSEVLREETFGPLTAKQHQKLATIEQSGQHLLELINDVLDLSKIEAGKMELQLAPTDISGLCNASLAFVRQQAHQKRIQLTCQVPPQIGKIEIDERRMRQVLINLLSNSVKFTPEGGAVWLEVQADREREIVQFSVVDTGIGIAPQDINKLFRPFVQLEGALNRRYAGTGLGLALVRQVVELHGGSISLESEVGKGSRFTVSVPWRQKSEAIAHQESCISYPYCFNLNQVLIVEDSAPAAEQVAHYLLELGVKNYTIHSLGTGTTAAALQLNPDAIILDLQLPDRSGWDVLAQLRSEQKTQHIPILIVSVADEPARTGDLGVCEYLVKPFSRHQFQLALRKLIAKRDATDNPKPAAETTPLILLAEDSETTIYTIVEYLEVKGYRMATALNGIQAVQMTKQLKPDLVLMDIQIPEMDGLEATRQIRADGEIAATPIIALTSLALPGDREKCLEAGATEYLTKPVSLKKLTEAIAQFVVRS